MSLIGFFFENFLRGLGSRKTVLLLWAADGKFGPGYPVGWKNENLLASKTWFL